MTGVGTYLKNALSLYFISMNETTPAKHAKNARYVKPLVITKYPSLFRTDPGPQGPEDKKNRRTGGDVAPLFAGFHPLMSVRVPPPDRRTKQRALFGYCPEISRNFFTASL